MSSPKIDTEEDRKIYFWDSNHHLLIHDENIPEVIFIYLAVLLEDIKYGMTGILKQRMYFEYKTYKNTP